MMKNSDQTDETLLQEYFKTKDPKFINEIFTRYADVGFRTAMRYVHNESDAEDVLQSAYIQFLKNVFNFRAGTSTVKPWLMKMIVNASKVKLREEARRAHRQQKVASERFSRYQENEVLPETLNEREELKVKIRSFVNKLPEKYHDPIWLVLYEGFTYPEVASVLALPEKTVRTQVSRGLEKLKAIFGSKGSVVSVSLILGLIAESKLEAAPASVKLLIDSPTLYNRALPTKILTNTSTALMPFKTFLGLITITSTIIGSLYIFNNVESNPFFSKNNQAVASLPKVNAMEAKETNQIWDFANKKDRELLLLKGEWAWSNELKSMTAPVNGYFMLQLPIIYQEKCFVIEHYVTSLATNENPDIVLNLTSYWAKGDQMLGTESSSRIRRYRIPSNKIISIKSYFYKNHIYSFANDEFIGSRKYSEELTGANVVMICRNYAIKKVVSKTFDIAPKEIIATYELISEKKGKIQNKWSIKNTTVNFND